MNLRARCSVEVYPITCIYVKYLAEGSSSDQREPERSEMEIESLKLNVQRRVRLFPPHKIQNICDSKCAKMLREWVDMKVREKERPWSKYPWFKASSDYKCGNTFIYLIL